MARTEDCVISRERSNTQNFHKLLKSRSIDRCRQSSKQYNRDTSPVNKSQFKTLKEEDDEFAATLRKEETLNHNNCTWLSSSGARASSPSSCFEDNCLSSYTDVKIDAWFISLLSTSSIRSRENFSTKATFFDGSIANPIEEASLVLDQRKTLNQDLFFHENLEEKEVVSWLATSIENESTSVSSITDSSDEHSSSSCSSSDYSSEVVDLEEIGTNKPLFWPSDLMSDWDSETKWDLFIMSPRKDTYKIDSDKGCNRRLIFGTHQKSSTNLDLKNENGIKDVRRMRNKTSRIRKPAKTSTKIVPFDNEAEFGELKETKVVYESESMDTMIKTPAFWTSECASEWGSDAKLDFFVMTPRKDVCNFSKSPKTSPNTLRLQTLTENMDLEKGCRRRLKFSGCKRAEVKPLTTKPLSENIIVLEDLLLVDKLNVEGSIEEALGLDEIDGHEGLESEFNKDGFSLVEIF